MEAGTEAKEKASSRVIQLPAADRTRTRPSDPHTVLSVSTTIQYSLLSLKTGSDYEVCEHSGYILLIRVSLH